MTWRVIGACAVVVATVTTDSGTPPQRLIDTGLYSADGLVDARNRPFAPQYPLWSDGMTKRRWVHLPEGTAIEAAENDWNFPVGTKFWKEFSVGGVKVETRFLWKSAASAWTFGTYVWNEPGTEAVLAPQDGVPGAIEVSSGRRHGIPSRPDCLACHDNGRVGPLGFNALQLSTDRDPNAIHGEPLVAGMVTLKDLVASGRLSSARADLVTSPPRIRTEDPETRAVLGYLAANCGTCHNGSASVSVLGPSLRIADLIEDGDRVARSLIGRPSRWQVPGAAEGESVLVRPGAPEMSALFLRMRSRSPASQMPPLGTVVRDQQALDAIHRWISTIEQHRVNRQSGIMSPASVAWLQR
jgi:hypothetical protein